MVTGRAILYSRSGIGGQRNFYTMQEWIENPNRISSITANVGTGDFKGNETIVLDITAPTSGAIYGGAAWGLDTSKTYRVEIWDRSDKVMGRNFFGIYLLDDNSNTISAVRYGVRSGNPTSATYNLYFITHWLNESHLDWTRRVTFLIPHGSDPTELFPLTENIDYIVEFPEGYDTMGIYLRWLNYNNTEPRTVELAHSKVNLSRRTIDLIPNKGIFSDVVSNSLIDARIESTIATAAAIRSESAIYPAFLDRSLEVGATISTASGLEVSDIAINKNIVSNININSYIDGGMLERNRLLESTITTSSSIDSLLNRNREIGSSIAANSSIWNPVFYMDREIGTGIHGISSISSPSLWRNRLLESAISAGSFIAEPLLERERELGSTIYGVMYVTAEIFETINVPLFGEIEAFSSIDAYLYRTIEAETFIESYFQINAEFIDEIRSDVRAISGIEAFLIRQQLNAAAIDAYLHTEADALRDRVIIAFIDGQSRIIIDFSAGRVVSKVRLKGEAERTIKLIGGL